MPETLNPVILDWLLSGDPAIEFQARRDLLNEDGPRMATARSRIAREGWGRRYMAARHLNGHWGRGLYQPKWTSTHYTLLDLAHLQLPPDNDFVRESVGLVLGAPRGADGGVNLARSLKFSDVCVNGMILNYASYFRPDDRRLGEVVDYLLERRMLDGGWNCEYVSGSTTSSVHSTLSVIEGLQSFRDSGGRYRTADIKLAQRTGEEFILAHRLYRSRKTGEVIDPRFLRLTFPCRWRFDILRALDYLRLAGRRPDERMSDALDVVRRKRQPDGRWLLAAPHPGRVHFSMEDPGKPSRWNTLRALLVQKCFDK
jgi:hypothetical protein